MDKKIFKNLSFSRDPLWRLGVAVITAVHIHSSKPELRLCAGSNPACGVLEIQDGEDL